MDDEIDIYAELDKLMGTAIPTFDKEGKPIPFSRYCELKQDKSYWQIGKDFIQQGDTTVEVSTVWIGQKLNGMLSATPDHLLLFETMVFCDNGSYAHRYATEAEAKAGHEHIVTAINTGKPILLADQSLGAMFSKIADALHREG